MSNVWTKEKAWNWYESRPWIVGCNFIPSNCINGIEIWQEFNFDQVLETISNELELAASIGMNSIRMGMPFYVWRYQRDGFLKRMDVVLEKAKSYNISMMPVFFGDCCVPKELCGKPAFGKQPEPVPGCHGGTAVTPFGGSARVGYNLSDDKENWTELEEFVRDIISHFSKDERILMWDIWNEPGNSNRGTMSLEFMERAFEIARDIHPIQPLTAGAWDFGEDFIDPFKGVDELSEVETRAVELSDILTFHYYGSYENTVKVIEGLKRFDRPMIITEWLHRPFGNNVQNILPLFKKEGIGCINWGLVSGKTQTHEPWDVLRKIPELDLTLWQHDLFYKNGTPYCQEEIDTFRSLCLDK